MFDELKLFSILSQDVSSEILSEIQTRLVSNEERKHYIETCLLAKLSMVRSGIVFDFDSYTDFKYHICCSEGFE